MKEHKIRNKSRKDLVLDLDHTIIYCEKKILRSSKVVRNIITRPFLFDFLNDLKKYYRLNIFTAGDKKYCEFILSTIKNKNYKFYEILNRDHLSEGKKKLNEISNDYKKIILIDDNDYYFENKKNAIKIKPFYGKSNDRVLLKLKNILIKINKFDDMTKGISVFKNELKKINK